MQSILKLENVTKRYNTQNALENFSLSIKEGEIVGLVGPNGAGKTTLMRIIVGLIRNFEGSVFINGINSRENASLSRKHLGCVIESPKFYPYMSGYENLKFFSELTGTMNIKQINYVVELLGLSKAINKKVRDYSLGMKQRLGIAQSLIQNPKLLILDEPTNGLDPSGIVEIREYLIKIVEEKKIAMLISSHVLSEIEKICNRVLIIQNGKLIEILDLNQSSNEGENVIFAFETSEPERLAEYFRSNSIKVEEVAESIVKIETKNSEMSCIIREATKSGIEFTSVYEVKITLEDKFLNLMGGNKIE